MQRVQPYGGVAAIKTSEKEFCRFNNSNEEYKDFHTVLSPKRFILIWLWINTNNNAVHWHVSKFLWELSCDSGGTWTRLSLRSLQWYILAPWHFFLARERCGLVIEAQSFSELPSQSSILRLRNSLKLRASITEAQQSRLDLEVQSLSDSTRSLRKCQDAKMYHCSERRDNLPNWLKPLEVSALFRR
jgi:hypothetical protein